MDHYVDEGGKRLAARFIDAVEEAASRLGQSPHIGSLRFSYDLQVPELRAWSLNRFLYMVFYMAKDDRVDVWRVLHSRRDLPALFTNAD